MNWKLLFVTLVGFFLLTPLAAQAGNKSTTECVGVECPAWKSGDGAKAGAPTKCLVVITAPTFGGKIGLDVRDANRASRWKNSKGEPAPRIKENVPAGTVTYKIGCNWLSEITAEVYMCAQGIDGHLYSSILWRKDGDLDNVLITRHLELCLKGAECPDYIPGPPPAH